MCETNPLYCDCHEYAQAARRPSIEWCNCDDPAGWHTHEFNRPQGAWDVERLARAIHAAEGFSPGTFDDADCADVLYAESVVAADKKLRGG